MSDPGTTQVDQLIAAVLASECDADAAPPPPLFGSSQLLDAIAADLVSEPAWFCVDDDILASRAEDLTAVEVHGGPVWAQVALRVARLLAGPHDLDADREIDVVIGLVRSTGAVAEQGVGRVPDDLARGLPEESAVRALMLQLGRKASEPAVAFLSLLALHLTGQDPRTLRAVSTAVALVTTTPFGVTPGTATLVVEEVKGGPAGAVPDPPTMFGLRSSDRSLAEAVERARHHVDPEGLRSFRWRVAVDRPILEIDGPSLAAGWAVAGVELTERARRRPRIRAVSARVAITGDVAEDGTLGHVGHIEPKARAALAARRDGFVYPAVDGIDLSSYRSSQFTPTAAADVAEAHRAARTTFDRSLLVLAAASVVIIALLAVGLVLRNDALAEQEARDAAAAKDAQAKDLLNLATRLRSTDLRSSLLTAYESNALVPSERARDLMTEGIGEGTSLRRVVPTTAEAVAVEAVRPLENDGPWQVAVLDSDGAVAVSDVSSGELLGTFRMEDRNPYEAIAVNPLVPWIVTASDESVQQRTVPGYDGIGTAPQLQPAVCPGTEDESTLLTVSADGARIAASSGSTVCVWNALTGERTAVVDVRQLPTDGQSAGLTGPITALALGTDASTLLVGGDGGFDDIDLTTWVRRPVDVDPGLDVVSLATYRTANTDEDTVLAATAGGLQAQLPGATSTTRLPTSGAEVRGVEANVDGSIVVVLYADEIVRLDAAEDFAPMTGDDAVSSPVPAGIWPDVALLDDSAEEGVLAALGGEQVLLLTGRVPAQQWASIPLTGRSGVALSADASRVVSFGDASATGYELTTGLRNVVTEYGAGTPLDLPAELDGAPLRIRDAFFTSGEDEHLVVYGFSYVGPDDPTVPLVRLFDGSTFAPQRDLVLPGGLRRQIVEVLQVDDELLVLDVSGRMTGFDLATGERTRTVELEIVGGVDLASDPAGGTIALASSEVDSDGQPRQPPDGSITFLSYADLEPTGAPVPAPGGAVWNMAFLSGSLLLVHSADERIYELTAHTGANENRVWQAREPVTLADGAQTADRFDLSRDRGHVVVTRSGKVTVYRSTDWDSPELVLGAGDTAVTLGAFVPDGSGIAAMSEGSLGLWDLPPEDLLEQICAVVGTGFSEEEWREHIGDMDHEQRCPERTAPQVVEISGEEFEGEVEGDPSSAPPLAAAASTCADFESVRPDGCLTYGTDDRSHALVLTQADDTDVQNLLTQWTRTDSRWEASREHVVYAGSLQRLDIPDGPSQASYLIDSERSQEILVFDGEEVVLQVAGTQAVSDTIIVANEPVPRGQQATYQFSRRQRLYRWVDGAWRMASVAPDPAWTSQIALLAPDALAGVPLGSPFGEVVTAVDAALINAVGSAIERTDVAWTDGLTETVTERWTEREPMNLVESCWFRQLCAYGDTTGQFVGWRYDAGRARHALAGGTSASTADRLGLATAGGLLAVTASGSADRAATEWPEASVRRDGDLSTFVIGVVRPKGGVAARPARRPATTFAELAGAVRWQDLSVGDDRVLFSFDSGLSYSWQERNGRIELTDWTGDGPLGLGVYAEGEVTALGAIPGPQSSDWTLVVCDTARGVAATASGPSGPRSWLVTATGLASVEPAAGC